MTNKEFREIKAAILRGYVSNIMDKMSIMHLDENNLYHIALIHMNETAAELEGYSIDCIHCKGSGFHPVGELGYCDICSGKGARNINSL